MTCQNVCQPLAPSTSAASSSPSLSNPLSPVNPLNGLDREVPPDPTIAVGAAVAMAVLFPSVGLIVGLIFLMFDNRRRVEIGKITLIWSVVFFVVHTVATGILLPIMARSAMEKILPGLGGMHASPSQPGPNDRAPSNILPSGFNMP